MAGSADLQSSLNAVLDRWYEDVCGLRVLEVSIPKLGAWNTEESAFLHKQIKKFMSTRVINLVQHLYD